MHLDLIRGCFIEILFNARKLLTPFLFCHFTMQFILEENNAASAVGCDDGVVLSDAL